MTSIVTGAREQSAGLSEIGQAVAEIDRGTQQNAAMVEETSAATAALSSEAQTLDQLMGAFATQAERPIRKNGNRAA